MGDFYIVSPKKFARHPTFASAALERERLRRNDPNAPQRFIYRCKTTVRSNGNYPDMEAYVRRLAEAGDPEAAALIARIDAQEAANPSPQPEPSYETEVAA